MQQKKDIPNINSVPTACVNGYTFKTWITTMLGLGGGLGGLKGSLSLRSSNRRPVNSSGSGNVVFLGGNHPPRPIQSSPPKPIPSYPPRPILSNPLVIVSSILPLPNNLSTSRKGVVLSVGKHQVNAYINIFCNYYCEAEQLIPPTY